MWNWFQKFHSEKRLPGTGHGEISEKRTTKVGYFLLFFMGLFIVLIGQTVFEDLSRIPEKPVMLSRCLEEFSDLLGRERKPDLDEGIYEYTDYYGAYPLNGLAQQNCTFGSSEETTGVAATIRAVYPELRRYYEVQAEINRLQQELVPADRERTLERENYDISLQERQAGMMAPVSSEPQKNLFQVKNQAVLSLETEKQMRLSEQENLVRSIQQKSGSFGAQYDAVKMLYKRAYNWYRIEVFFLSLLFVLPLLLFCLKKYLTWKEADSPYTIIVGAALGALAILFLQVAGVFLYDIIPRRLIQLLIDFFTQFAFLRYVLYYGSVLVVIALFGGIVYYIQKKVFSREAVARRALKDRKCPVCAFSIDLSMQHCPECGHALQSECDRCHGLRFTDLPVCYRCGTRKE